MEFYNHFCSFSKTKFATDVLALGSLHLKKLSILDSTALVRDFSIMELDNALKLSRFDKAPGPDGISMGGMKKLRSFMSKDIFEFVKGFHRDSKILVGFKLFLYHFNSKIGKPSSSG